MNSNETNESGSNTQLAERSLSMVRKWLDLLVIELNLCPFAKTVRDKDLVDLFPVAGQPDMIVQALLQRFALLDSAETASTTLMVIYQGYDDFDDYLNLLDLCQAVLEDQDYEGVYQLASFHPDYCFADTRPEDLANFTNRAPCPIIQILNEASMEQVLANYPDAHEIPQRNIARMRKLGLNAIEERLKACR